MSKLNRIRFGRLVAAVAIVTTGLPPARAFAQTPAPPQAQAAPAPTGPVLRLSMQEAEDMALETNLGLKSDRLNVDIAAQNIASARAAFLPFLSSGFSRSTARQVPGSFTESTESQVSSGSVGFNSQMSQQLPWYGGSYSVRWSGSRSTTTGITNFNPRLGSTVNVGFTQPLLRNFAIDSDRARLRITEQQRVVSDLALQQRILATRAVVQSAYLNLIASIARRQVNQRNLDTAQEQLRSSRARVAVGVDAQISTIQSEAAVASNEEGVIVSEAAVASAQDNLRALILDLARPDYWQVQFEPTDTIEVRPTTVNVEAAIVNALANRLDVVVARKNMETTDLNIRVLENQKLPAVDFQVNYVATGTGGTQLELSEGFPPVILSQTQRGFGSVLGDVFGYAFPQWTVGVNVQYPIGRTGAQTAAAIQQIQRRQQELALRNLELGVVAEVRQAGRDVQTAAQRVQATRTAREANERQLDAERRRFEVGIATTFDVLQRQSLLASALNQELSAKIAYNQALIDFERVQKIR